MFASSRVISYLKGRKKTFEINTFPPLYPPKMFTAQFSVCTVSPTLNKTHTGYILLECVLGEFVTNTEADSLCESTLGVAVCVHKEGRAVAAVSH